MKAVLTVLAASLVASAAAAQTREPYLQRGTPDEITVVWRTASSSASVVCYGADPSSLTYEATGASGTHHEVRITGLSPDTRYHYAVGSGTCPPAGGGATEDYFVTAPVVGTPQPFRMWVVGDSGTGGSRQAAVRDAMLADVGANVPDLFLHVGDMAYSDGTTQEFDDNFYAMYAGILRNTVCWPAMGNHEGHTSDSASQSGPYYEGYVLPTDGVAGGLPSGTEAYYSFDYANVHFIILDSHQSGRDPGDPMLTWVEADVAATDQPWIVAYWHHPPYTKGSHDSDSEGALVDMRENVLPILEAAGVDLVLTGHSHIYERSFLVQGAYDTPTTAAGHIVDPGDGRPSGDGAYLTGTSGAVYIVAGHGGTGVSGAGDHPLMFFSEVDNGSVIIDVDGATMTLRNIRSDGVESDTVTLVKGEGLILLTPRGGQQYLPGAMIDISWATVGAPGGPSVRLEYSLDGGTGWMTIADSTENDGVHPWTLPTVETTMARVRVTDLSDPASTAQSGNFEIRAMSERVAIPFGSVWEYQDQGTEPAAGWQTDASGGWPSGPAELGYGDGDEATELFDDDPNVPSVALRHVVRIDREVVGARVDLVVDDGAIVYVNGQQVFAHNADDDAFDAYATTTSSDNERVGDVIDVSAFVVGDNVITALAKQGSASSSDLSFDLELTIEERVDVPPPGPDGAVVGPDGAIVGPDGAVPDGGVPGGGGDDDGCGCTAAGERSRSAVPVMLLLAVGAGLWHRRCRRTGRLSR